MSRSAAQEMVPIRMTVPTNSGEAAASVETAPIGSGVRPANHEAQFEPRRWDDSRLATPIPSPSVRRQPYPASRIGAAWDWFKNGALDQAAFQQEVPNIEIPTVDVPGEAPVDSRITPLVFPRKTPEDDRWFRGRGYRRLRDFYESRLSRLDDELGPAKGERLWLYDNIFTGRYSKVMVEPVGERRMDRYFYNSLWQFNGDVYEDYMNFYSFDSQFRLGLVLLLAGALANTKADENFQNWFQDNVQDEDDQIASWGRVLGEWYTTVPITALAWGLGEMIEANPMTRGSPVNMAVRDWGRQSVRSYLVTAPMVIALQWGLGASRPLENPDKGSSWDPFDDNNSASGHAAAGAVPFLVAAKMTDRWWLKTLLVLGSGIAGYSRIVDNAHFLSQVILGYSVAYLSVEATELTNQSRLGYRLVPLTLTGVWGVGIEWRL